MKKPGNTCEFAQERDAALMEAFRHELLAHRDLTLSDIARSVARRPTSRFWVSEERAVVVISAMLHGKDVTSGMHPSKRRMYEEIFRRVLQVRAMQHDLSLPAMVAKVIYTEAPEFYLSPRYILDRITITRKRSRLCRQQS